MAERATAPTKKASRSLKGKPAAQKAAAGKAKPSAAKPEPKPAGKTSPPVNRSANKGGLDTAMVRLEREVTSLRQERDALTRDLQAAQSRIATLESTQEQAINRIDWVIDSLHNVMNEKS